jgi:hypothetical protein
VCEALPDLPVDGHLWNLVDLLGGQAFPAQFFERLF